MHNHNCNRCIYLYTKHNIDYYVCPFDNKKVVDTIVARYGSLPYEYGSGEHIGVHQEARNYLRKQGWTFRFCDELTKLNVLEHLISMLYAERPTALGHWRRRQVSALRRAILELRQLRKLMEE